MSVSSDLVGRLIINASTCSHSTSIEEVAGLNPTRSLKLFQVLVPVVFSATLAFITILPTKSLLKDVTVLLHVIKCLTSNKCQVSKVES